MQWLLRSHKMACRQILHTQQNVVIGGGNRVGVSISGRETRCHDAVAIGHHDINIHPGAAMVDDEIEQWQQKGRGRKSRSNGNRHKKKGDLTLTTGKTLQRNASPSLSTSSSESATASSGSMYKGKGGDDVAHGNTASRFMVSQWHHLISGLANRTESVPRVAPPSPPKVVAVVVATSWPFVSLCTGGHSHQ